MKKSKLIIVGAGAAGIAAASRLITHGVDDFVLLEAENRIGGRVHTIPYEGNTSIDLGAQWIHGQKGNPVFEMAKEFNMTEDECPQFFRSLSFNSSRLPIDREDSLRLFELIATIMDDDEDIVKHDGSLGEYVRQRLATELKNHTTLKHLQSSPLFEDVLEFFGKFENSYDGSDTWFETSAKTYNHYVTPEGCRTTIWKTGGYSNVFKLLLKEFPGQTKIDLGKKILLNKEVDKISWEGPNTVIATCADGTEYIAEKLLSTVSLGVLKSRPDLFVPPLPSWKTNAIQGLFIGTVDKIFIKFPYKWWSDDIPGVIGFNFFWTKGDEKKVLQDIGGVDGKPWVVDAFGFYLTTQDPLTFLGWVTGPSARYMETLSNEQVQIDTVKLFRHFLGANYTIPEPVRVLKSTWGTNKHFKGSYSCRSLTTDRLNTSAKDLASPVENSKGQPVVLFAGEATHEHYFSTVHGAVESGWREADRILKSESLVRYSSCIDKDVVVVGAGMAGLGAALTLLENGCTKFVLLEAQGRAGGRVQSVHIGNGDYLEEGAQWIHGQDNPVYRWADEHRLTSPIRSDEAQGRYLKEDGTEIPLALVNQVAGAIGDILEKCEEFWNSQDKDYPDSIGHYLDEQFESYVKCQPPDADVPTMRQLYDWHRRFQIIDNSCSSLHDLSARSWGQYGFCGGDDYINLTQGYSSVVDAMVQRIPAQSIRYTCPVKQILWQNLAVTNDHVVYIEDQLVSINDNGTSCSANTECYKLRTIDTNGFSCEENIRVSKETNHYTNEINNSSEETNRIFENNHTSENTHSLKECHHTCHEKCHNSNKNNNTDHRSNQYKSSSERTNWNGHDAPMDKQGDSLDQVIVKCVDGTTYRTKCVIVTASLGYLKENQAHMFVPRLPKHWSQAISTIGFGSITKIFLVYSEPWWGPTDRGFQFVWSASADSQFDPWLREITGFDVLANQRQVLLGWVGGACAEEVEMMPEEEIGDACSTLLSHFTRRNVPRPVRVVRSSWRTNNYIRGAYSHTTTSCDELGITTHNLTIPVKTKQRNVIYFAGEALHEKYFSTAHGAFLSGSEQAQRVLKDLRTEV